LKIPPLQGRCLGEARAEGFCDHPSVTFGDSSPERGAIKEEILWN